MGAIGTLVAHMARKVMKTTEPAVHSHGDGPKLTLGSIAFAAKFAVPCKKCIRLSDGREAMREILLAEDNPADVYLIREALREHGVSDSVRVAADGREVLRLLCPPDSESHGAPFGLIILDLNLPRHDGIEILERMRETNLSATPVVILTSSDSPRDQRIANDLGATCYLRKPSSLDQFLALGAVLKSLMDGTHARSTGF